MFLVWHKHALITDKISKMKEGEKDNVAGYLYMACGTEDFLIEENRNMRDFLQKLGYHFTYEEGSGTHDWEFWDEYIEKAICWINRK